MGVFADIGSSLLARWGLDRVQLTALRKVQRRSGLGVAASMPADGQSRSRWRTAARFYSKFALYAVAGLMGVAGVLFPSFFFGFVFSYTLIMLIVGLTLLNYFTTVLLDPSENRILLHLPISGRTLLAARILCVAKYAGLVALSVSLPIAVAIAVRFGAVALVAFAISLVLTLILIATVTLAVCLFALRYVKPARIKQGVVSFQLGLIVVAIYAGSAVINADMPLVERLPDVSGAAWWYFYPPGWMAGLLEFFLIEKTRFNGVLAAIAVLAPLAGFLGCIALFAGRRFTTLLSRLEVVPRRDALKRKGSTSWLTRLPEWLSALINADKQQRAVFDLTSKLMKRDLALTLGTYTYIAMMLVQTGGFVATHHADQMQDLPLALALVFYGSCYMPLLVAYMAPGIQYSAEWRAAWCYEVLPFAKRGVIVSGTLKAYICIYVLPAYLLLLVVSAAVWGIVVALDILLAAVVVTLACVHRFSRAAGVLPYSRERVSHVPQDDGVVRALVFGLISVGWIVAHVVVLKTIAGSWGVVAGIVTISGATVVAYRKLWFTSSKDVEAPNRHVGWHRS